MPKTTSENQTPDSLRINADMLADEAARLRGIAENMSISGIDSAEIPNYTSLILGMKRLQTFIDGARKTVYGMMEQNGKFKAAKEKPKKRG
jgi:hypothetical protein